MKRILAIGALVGSQVASAGMRMQGPGDARRKCLAMGYRERDQVSACQRAMRADFCGDGTAHTIDGVIVDFVDGIIQVQDSTWPLEAGWTPDGALCVSRDVRRRGLRAGSLIAACTRSLPICKSDTPVGALLITRTLGVIQP